MHSTTPLSAPLRVSQADSLAPSQATESDAGADLRSSQESVGKGALAEVHAWHSTADACIRARVERIEHDLSAGRVVSDADLLQHRMDCTRLMEEAAQLWLQGCESRETVQLWHAMASEAHKRLSAEWKAAREAQIQQAINESAGYFIGMGDAARARIGGRG